MGRPRLRFGQRKIATAISLDLDIVQQARTMTEDDNLSKLVRDLIVAEWSKRKASEKIAA